MFKLLLIFLSLHQVMAWPWPNVKYYDLELAEEYFMDFIETFDKNYESEEEYEKRFQIFVENLEKFNVLNDHNETETYGITEFADMTFNEFAEKYGLFEMDSSKLENDAIEFEYKGAPASWDWRQQGAVGPVKSQGQCGSCWAFSAVATVEGQYARRYGRVQLLSEQQILDCSTNPTPCDKGVPHIAMADMATVGGWNSESDYPYQAVKGRCRYDASRSVARVSGGSVQTTSSEEQLKELVYSYGPVSISVYVTDNFRHYNGGVATAQALGCRGNEINNHAVTVVGYGSEGNRPYWIIKNSWDTTWGEQGYMRLEMGTNACGLLQYAAVAQLA